MFINTDGMIEYSFTETDVAMEMDLLDDIYIIPGDIDNAIKTYTSLTGACKLPPKWSFGPWISANRWNCQEHINKQIAEIKKHNYPVNSLVIEAWSDEATFYIFNEGKYEPKQGNFTADEITYNSDGLWPDPKGMIDELHDMGIKTILWQVPIVKKLEEGRHNAQHDIDYNEVVEKGYIIKDADGSHTQSLMASGLVVDIC